VILASSSVVSLLIVVSPYVLISHDPGAISIGASLNSTNVSQNETVLIAVSDRNTLRLPDELSLSGDWAAQNLTLGACVFPRVYPFGVAIFQGRYALDNISSAKSLLLYPDFPGEVYSCPTAYAGGDSIKFRPLQNISLSMRFSGYYTYGLTPVPGLPGGTVGIHHAFAPGGYTLVAGDEWGHVEMLYFQVAASSPTTPTSSACLSNTQMQTTSTSDLLVLEMGHMPANFSVGGYQFATVFNGTGYSASSNGHSTVNLGWSMIYDVSNGTQTQSVTFGWAPDGPSSGQLPVPSNSTGFNGRLSMVWVETCNSMFLEINTQA
jgi:hypothetical protein